MLDVMSMWRLPIPSRDDHTKLLELTTQLNKVESLLLSKFLPKLIYEQRLLDPGMTEESIHQDVDLTYIFAQLYVLDSVSRSITTSQHVSHCASPGAALYTEFHLPDLGATGSDRLRMFRP